MTRDFGAATTADGMGQVITRCRHVMQGRPPSGAHLPKAKPACRARWLPGYLHIWRRLHTCSALDYVVQVSVCPHSIGRCMSGLVCTFRGSRCGPCTLAVLCCVLTETALMPDMSIITPSSTSLYNALCT